MSAILTIVMEKEIRDYANGKVSPDCETDIRQAIENDELAYAVFKDEIKQGKEKNMKNQEQIKMEKHEVKQGDNSSLSARILTGSLIFVAALGVIAFAALNTTA